MKVLKITLITILSCFTIGIVLFNVNSDSCTDKEKLYAQLGLLAEEFDNTNMMYQLTSEQLAMTLNQENINKEKIGQYVSMVDSLQNRLTIISIKKDSIYSEIRKNGYQNDN